MTDPRKAPWPDFYGNPLYEGDLIVHFSGEQGRVVYLPDEALETDQWRVDYGDGSPLRLALQLGAKGRAVVTRLKTQQGK